MEIEKLIGSLISLRTMLREIEKIGKIIKIEEITKIELKKQK